MKIGDTIKSDEDWYALPVGTIVEVGGDQIVLDVIEHGGWAGRPANGSAGVWRLTSASCGLAEKSLVSLPVFDSLADAPDGEYLDRLDERWERRDGTMFFERPGGWYKWPKECEEPGGPFRFVRPLGGWPSERGQDLTPPSIEEVMAEDDAPFVRQFPVAPRHGGYIPAKFLGIDDGPIDIRRDANGEAFCVAIRLKQEALKETLDKAIKEVEAVARRYADKKMKVGPHVETVTDAGLIILDDPVGEPLSVGRAADLAAWYNQYKRGQHKPIKAGVEDLPSLYKLKRQLHRWSAFVFRRGGVGDVIRSFGVHHNYTTCEHNPGDCAWAPPERVWPAGPDPMAEIRRGATKAIGEQAVPYPDNDEEAW